MFFNLSVVSHCRYFHSNRTKFCLLIGHHIDLHIGHACWGSRASVPTYIVSSQCMMENRSAIYLFIILVLLCTAEWMTRGSIGCVKAAFCYLQTNSFEETANGWYTVLILPYAYPGKIIATIMIMCFNVVKFHFTSWTSVHLSCFHIPKNHATVPALPNSYHLYR